MSERNFREMLETKWDQEKFVCVGLDSDYEKIPACIAIRAPMARILRFNIRIIEATWDLVCAYKLNIAFYAAQGSDGEAALAATISQIHHLAPDVPVILDSKRGDIGNTNNGYVQEAFERFDADAVTVPPYLGRESLKPFLDLENKGIFVLCRTSNPGAGEFQDLIVDGQPLYQIVAQHVASSWNQNNNCGLVAGATYPEEIVKIRALVGEMPLLLPGVGKQGGDVQQAVKAAKDKQGKGFIVHSARGVIFASSEPDFADRAREETLKLHQEIPKHL